MKLIRNIFVLSVIYFAFVLELFFSRKAPTTKVKKDNKESKNNAKKIIKENKKDKKHRKIHEMKHNEDEKKPKINNSEKDDSKKSLSDSKTKNPSPLYSNFFNTHKFAPRKDNAEFLKRQKILENNGPHIELGDYEMLTEKKDDSKKSLSDTETKNPSPLYNDLIRTHKFVPRTDNPEFLKRKKIIENQGYGPQLGDYEMLTEKKHKIKK